MNNDLKYQIALLLVPGVGSGIAKMLYTYFGSAHNVFKAPKAKILKVPGIGQKTAQALINFQEIDRAEQEIEFILKRGIQPILFTDDAYPLRLKHCADSPFLLFVDGAPIDLNRKMIGIVGTRNATKYGKTITKQIVEELVPSKPVIVSGLAYGIDVAAHQAALEFGLDTIGVVAHGHDTIYPPSHKAVASQMTDGGAVISEFLSGTKPDRENFPRRNRIVAGMVDALIVVESAARGGAIITAEIASSYSREVYAVPGRIGDTYSQGCNWLIKSHRAGIFTSTAAMVKELGWLEQALPPRKAKENTFFKLNDVQQDIIDLFEKKGDLEIDNLNQMASYSTSQVAGAMLELEFMGLIQVKPGKLYGLV